jgi:hypothetical protein
MQLLLYKTLDRPARSCTHLADGWLLNPSLRVTGPTPCNRHGFACFASPRAVRRASVLKSLKAARGSALAIVAAGRERERESEGEVAEVVAFSPQLLALRLCLF